jgi:pimeloyl-ACP methyl ester carboxylesterase
MQQPIPRSHLTVSSLSAAHIVVGKPADVPILALHGWGASADLIAPLANRLAAHGFCIYVPDLPGFGQSEPPPNAWAVHDYAQWVLSYLDTVGVPQVQLFGHSFGGRVGIVISAEHPDRVGKLVLADSAGVLPPRRAGIRLRLSLYKAVRSGLYSIGARALADRLRNAYVARYGSADYKSAGALRETFVKVVNEDLLPFAARISVPTLLIWGGKDEDTPVWQGRKLEQTIPDAGLVIYEDAGHYAYLDKLSDVVRTLTYFYKHEER